jgi:hypothetical protein
MWPCSGYMARAEQVFSEVGQGLGMRLVPGAVPDTLCNVGATKSVTYISFPI